MPARSLYFTGPGEVAVRETPLPEPDVGQVRVRTDTSAVSAGSELLVYRGEVAPDQPADASIDALDGPLEFPLRYGYAAVGEVTAVGADVDEDWLGRTAFAFHPHASHFVSSPADLHPVPDGHDPETAALLASVETAVNLVLDGGPRLGERVVVFGQGVVGLLATALLSRFPLSGLVTVDAHARRRAISEQFGANASLDPAAVDVEAAVRGHLEDDGHPEAGDGAADADDGGAVVDADGVDGADLAYELSGDPSALDDALDVTGYGGRVVVGSWYGTKPARLDLDTRFHRSRISVVSSQVSTIAPELRGRWSTDRRLQTAWRLLGELDADALLTHRFPIRQAAEAYELLDERPGDAVQVVLTYGD